MARGGSAKAKTSTPRVSVEVEPNVRETSAAAEWVHVSAWAPHAKNPRVHREEVLNLARTIIRTAWGAPVVAQWRASGKHRGIAGHGRILALTEILAGVEVDGELRGGPDFVLDGAPGPGFVPMRIVRVSDATADAMVLADNARRLQGTDDPALLVAMASQFGPNAEVMRDLGFDAASLDRLVALAGDGVLAGGGIDPDVERHEVIGGVDGVDPEVEEPAPDAKRVPSFGVFSREAIVDSAFAYFRATGFPYYDLPLHVQQQQVNRLHALDGEALLRTDTAYHVADTYNRHRLEASAVGMKSPLESFNADAPLRKAIGLHIDHAILGTSYSDKMNIVSGTQACSNFRPGFAAYLYRRFASRDGIVLDPSTGYGGRLVGWIASGLGGRYVGVDPNTLTFNANTRLAKALAPSGAVSLIHSPFEDADLREIEGQASFVFTSPPYFAKEIYSDEPTQSWKRYPTCDGWTRGFLAPLLSKSFASLRGGGTCVINIADVSIKGTTYDLEKRTVDAGIAAGFKHVDTLRFEMSRRFGSGSDEVATEPCFVFAKA